MANSLPNSKLSTPSLLSDRQFPGSMIGDSVDQQFGDSAETKAGPSDQHPIAPYTLKCCLRCIEYLFSRCNLLQAEYRARLPPVRHGPIVFLAQLRGARHKGGVRWGQRVAIKADVILKPCTRMPPQ